MDGTVVLIAVILVICVAFYILFIQDDTVSFPASNGFEYKVYAKRPDSSKRKAADILAELDDRVEKLLASPDDAYQADIKKHFSGTELRENLTEAYTLGKGTKVYLDLTPGKGDDGFYPIDLLMFVLIHEISHIAVPHDGHDQKFWNIFNKLLDKATNMGLYEPIHGTFDYSGQHFEL